MLAEQIKKDKSQYATVTEEGTNYREIADIMTMIGYKMNHSSARNYVLRIMKKFAYAITEKWDLQLSEDKIEEIIKDPNFQEGINDVLQEIEMSKTLTDKGNFAKWGYTKKAFLK